MKNFNDFLATLAQRATMLPTWTPATVKHRIYPHRKMDGKSLTIPDQSLPLRTILERYSRGLPVSGTNAQPDWDESEMPDIRTLDLSERMDMARAFTTELQQINDRVENNKQTIAANKLRQEIRDELEKELVSKPIPPVE